jgi:hypothetical protein
VSSRGGRNQKRDDPSFASLFAAIVLHHPRGGKEGAGQFGIPPQTYRLQLGSRARGDLNRIGRPRYQIRMLEAVEVEKRGLDQ